MDPWTTTRDEVIRRFAAFAAEQLAQRPTRRSIVLAIAQYWNDSADDEVHARTVTSSRDTPVWPHECSDEYNADGEYVATAPVLAGEECEGCGLGREGWFAFYGGHGDATVGAFELFCREGSNQDMETAEAYVPYAIARRRAPRPDRAHAGAADETLPAEIAAEIEVDIEIVGRPQRPASAVLGTDDSSESPWRDPAARALFHEICESPADDGPRVVLSDHLLETRPGDPRGEAIALDLVRDPDAATRARRDALTEAHLIRWIHPLGAVIPPGCAQLARGFLVRAEVYAPRVADLVVIRGAEAWGTVEVVRMMPGSRDVVDPAMRALREIGPLHQEGVTRLREAPRPWAIERLHVVLDQVGPHTAVGQLARTHTLPRLRDLVLTVGDAAPLASCLAKLARAPWWPQLARLTLVVPALASLAGWLDHRPAHASLTITLAGDDGQPAGWEVALAPDGGFELSMHGWHTDGTMTRLAELVAQLPRGAAVRLRSTATRTCGAAEVDHVAKHTGRTIDLA